MARTGGLELSGFRFDLVSGQYGHMSEPPLGSVAAKLPDGATVINEEEGTYFQLDTVFFKPIDSGTDTAYEVIASPDDSEIVEEDAEET